MRKALQELASPFEVPLQGKGGTIPRVASIQSCGLGILCVAALALSGCIGGYYLPSVPREYRGDFVVSPLGATLCPCRYKAMWGSDPEGTCLLGGAVASQLCVAVAPGTPVRVLHTFVRSAGLSVAHSDEGEYAQVDIALAVGGGGRRRVAHVSGDWGDIARELRPALVRPDGAASRQPSPPASPP